MSTFTIGKTTLKRGLVLAPMAGVTDLYFRRLCAACGAEYAVTEMISAKALCYEKQAHASAPTKSASLAYIEPNTIPTAVQLFGNDPYYMAEAAAMLCDGSYRGKKGELPDAIDINMGCPVKKVVSCGEGSALMKTPELAIKIVEAVKKGSSLPITVKIRAGWDKNSVNAPEFASALEAAGADLICIHGRTREQFYAPYASLEVISAVKESVKRIPVIGNGDINTAEDGLRMISETKCDGVMVARGAMGNPWLFSELCAAIDGVPYTPPTLSEKIEAALDHTRSVIAEKGIAGVAQAKGQLAWYIKGVRGAASARDAVHNASDFEEMERILRSLVNADKQEEKNE